MADDRKLVVRAQQGDRRAFEELVRRHQRRVYLTAFHLTGDHSEADDVAQGAFLRAFCALGQFDGRSSFGTWLYRIVINVGLDHRRRCRPGTLLDVDELPPGAEPLSVAETPLETLERRRLQVRLTRALDQLPPPLRLTAVLVSLGGLSHRLAAEILGCSEGTVSWRVHEARQVLRRILAAEADALRDKKQGRRE